MTPAGGPEADSSREAIYFFDTVTLSNFALAGRIDLLTERYGRRGQVTPEVLGEVLEGIVAGYRALEAVERVVEEGGLGATGALVAEERKIQRELLRTLAPAEASAIACASVRGGTVVTDDRAAREAAAERGVPTTGTVGILKASVRDGMLGPADADGVLRAMIDAGYYAPVRRISDLL